MSDADAKSPASSMLSHAYKRPELIICISGGAYSFADVIDRSRLCVAPSKCSEVGNDVVGV